MQHAEVEIALSLLHHRVVMRVPYACFGTVPYLPAGEEHLDGNTGVLPQNQVARKATAGTQRRQAVSAEGIGDVGGLDPEAGRIGQRAGLTDRPVVEEDHVRLERSRLPV